MKSNKKACLRLADRATRMIEDIRSQTKDYDDRLLEVQDSIAELDK